jgi:hypothetical protein
MLAALCRQLAVARLPAAGTESPGSFRDAALDGCIFPATARIVNRPFRPLRQCRRARFSARLREACGHPCAPICDAVMPAAVRRCRAHALPMSRRLPATRCARRGTLTAPFGCRRGRCAAALEQGVRWPNLAAGSIDGWARRPDPVAGAKRPCGEHADGSLHAAHNRVTPPHLQKPRHGTYIRERGWEGSAHAVLRGRYRRWAHTGTFGRAVARARRPSRP